MEIETIIRKRKEVYSSLIKYIENTEDDNTEKNKLIQILEDQETLKAKQEIISILRILSRILDNHHRTPNFFDKIIQIIQYLLQAKQTDITDFEVYKIFKNNKCLLLLLLEQGLIQPNDKIISDIMKKKDQNKYPYSHYLYSAIKSYINETELQQIQAEIKEKYDQDIQTFVQKCRIGENDSYICFMIRHDSIDEFISYINRNLISLSIQIQPSIYETNLFLMGKKPTLIEYASFFGSLQIIQYLQYNNVPITKSLWLYGAHSNNPELISFLESVKLGNYYFNYTNADEITYETVYKESIMCHHNAIADYIKENFMNQHEIYSYKSTITGSLNYYYYPDDMSQLNTKCIKFDKYFISMFCPLVDKITIPSSITNIADSFFYECSTLTQVFIPESVDSIGNYAFAKCTSLKQITFPTSLKLIGNRAFDGCSSLNVVSIQSNLSSIGEYAFNKCSSLNMVSILSVKLIGNYAFNQCLSLQKVTIQNIDSIGNNAFKECTSLKEISIKSVNSIGNNAFRDCALLKEIPIPNAVTIKDYAFYGCNSLTRISIPSSLTSIGEYAFYRCPKLQEILFETQSSLTSIGDSAFARCSSLASILIPSSLLSIGPRAFAGCSSVVQITFQAPSSLTSIEHEAFADCLSLKQISIPSSVTSIGYKAFTRCKSIDNITIPSSVNSIGNDVFEGCENLHNIVNQSKVSFDKICGFSRRRKTYL